jgi:diguanylate cyclase (GGDEF)-like protein/PAS domain S-box-containing protein
MCRVREESDFGLGAGVCSLRGWNDEPAEDLMRRNSVARRDRPAGGARSPGNNGGDPYRAFFEDSRDGLYITRQDGRIVHANAAFLALFRLSPEALGDLRVDALYAAPEDRKRFQGEIERHGAVVDYTLRLRRADGTTFDALLTATVRRLSGATWGYHGIIRDITHRKKIETDLRDSEERYRRLVEATPETILVHCRGRFVYLNPAGVALFGAEHEEELIGRDIIDFIHLDDVPLARERIQQVLQVDRAQPLMEQRVRKLDGTVLHVELFSIPFRHQGRPAVQTVMRDITDRKRTAEQLTRAALHDPVTGLPNRALLRDRLEVALGRSQARQGHRFAVLCLDLDGFKLINDSLGHANGDRLLVDIARRLEATLRPGDTLAHLGGDEFMFLMNDIRSLEDASDQAGAIETALEKPFLLDGHEVFTSACIGITLSHGDYQRPEEVLRDADIATYRAKRLGRGHHAVFDPPMHTLALAQLQLENDLRRAVDREEFTLFYQPIVSLEEGTLIGFEALVRWQHPERGLLLPQDFLPQAEETGLIVPLGAWVLREACRQGRQWQTDFPERKPVSVTVNLFSREFTQPDLVARTVQALQDANLDARYLRLEMTESVFIDDPELAVVVLEELAALNIRVVLDDFGTGYSSLSYLQRLPLDGVKIDRTFTGRLDHNGQGSALLEPILLLIHNLGMRAVAEGVENEAQLRRLREMGCDFAQGFHFARPLPKESAAGLIRENPRW